MNSDHRQVLNELIAAQNRHEPVALAVVIRAQGSVPRHAGTKMLVFADGRTFGTIGGGEMESRVVAEATQALATGETRLVPYSLVDPARGDPGVCGGNVEIFIEPYPAPSTLLILGCGHVGQSLATLGHWLGFRVIAWDDREEMATPSNVPEADVVRSGDLPAVLAAYPIDDHTYVAGVTRNVGLDRHLLPLLVDSPAAYIGVMGSRRRWEETKRSLLEDGVPPEKLERITAPIGLELNAESPNEIAVSIMAEIILTRRGGDGRPIAELAKAREKLSPNRT